MKFHGALLLILVSSACGPMKQQVEAESLEQEIQISRRSGISLKTVHQIMDSRGGREEGEIWYVDRRRGDVRIRKSRAGSNPDQDIEVWYEDADGSWSRRESVK